MADRHNFGPRHFNSFSGADIKAVFGNKEIGELQAISYAIQREKAPIYVMGHKNPLAFSRGKRGIAGACVFVLFDSHAMLTEMGIYSGDDGESKFLSSKDEYRPIAEGDAVSPVGVGNISESSAVTDAGSINFDAAYEPSKAWYVDQIPPFDVTITAANEYGAAMSMRIIGVELLNEGYGISVDDMVSEQQMTFVARAISPWRKVRRWKLDYSGAASKVTDA